MEPVGEKPAGQRIAGFPGGFKPGRTSDQQPGRNPLGVIDALNPGLPVFHLVKLIENDELSISRPFLIFYRSAVSRRIVVEIGVGGNQLSGPRGLSDWAGA